MVDDVVVCGMVDDVVVCGVVAGVVVVVVCGWCGGFCSGGGNGI